jgi:hypothetical protein
MRPASSAAMDRMVERPGVWMRRHVTPSYSRSALADATYSTPRVSCKTIQFWLPPS